MDDQHPALTVNALIALLQDFAADGHGIERVFAKVGDKTVPVTGAYMWQRFGYPNFQALLETTPED
ncbi:hypothetical protein N234_31570 [Ralstonia pickettii DTP0602]|nr:hypothetical protein N234_31570 [Ralstonia pickettii DTP0602]